jgi:hypothetical protein
VTAEGGHGPFRGLDAPFALEMSVDAAAAAVNRAVYNAGMSDDPAFAVVPPALRSIFEELRPREPIFHTAAFGRTRAEWERAMAPDYWEVGASGRRYSRVFILDLLEKEPPRDAVEAGWTCSDFGLRQLGPDIYWLTYTLNQGGRVTRRSTVWQKTSEGWRILFHQGTIVTAADNTTASTIPSSQ